MAGRDLDVVCLGEALVDLLPERRGRLREMDRFEVHSGGAPANVATGLARQGRAVAFCGVVGEDEFGHLLQERLRAEGILCALRYTTAAPTGIWFVALDAHGERTFFNPSRTASADKQIARSDVDDELIRRAPWLHCGASAHVLPEAQLALTLAMARARALGTQVSFDPNFRPALWPDPAEFAAFVRPLLSQCDLVKLSDEECPDLLRVADPERAAKTLVDLGVGLACITLGPRGALVRRGEERIEVPSPVVEVVDTTGAGDGFVAGLLSRIARLGDVRTLPIEAIASAARFGCELGAAVCTRLGAVAGLPRNPSSSRHSN